MFFITVETANKESDRYSIGEKEVNLFEVESLEALTDYFALELGSYMEEHGLTVTFEEITEAEAKETTWLDVVTL